MEKEVVYCISYDLRKPNKDYNSLYDGIKSFKKWWHQTESVWFISSNKSSVDIRTYLKQFIDENDKLFIVQVCTNWAGSGFSKEEYDWLHANIK